jgi:hypothetical protein
MFDGSGHSRMTMCGATTLSLMTTSLTTLSQQQNMWHSMMSSVMLSAAIGPIVLSIVYARFRYTHWLYAECHSVECRGQSGSITTLDDEFFYAECRNRAHRAEYRLCWVSLYLLALCRVSFGLVSWRRQCHTMKWV